MPKVILYLLCGLLLIACSCGKQVPVDQYLRDLKSTDREKQNQAAQKLLQAQDQAVPGLASLLKDEDEMLRLLVLRVLAKIHTPKSAEAALPALHDASIDVRLEAATTLAAGPLPAQGCSLFVAALRDPYWKVRSELAKGVARYNTREAVEAIAGLLEDEEPGVRSTAIQNLLTMKPEYVGDMLMAKLNSPDEQVRYIVVQALGNLGEKRAIPQLLKVLKESQNTFLRQKSALALAELKAQEAAPLIQNMCATGTTDEKKAAREALETLKNMP
jgi:HEAT repeat protein